MTTMMRVFIRTMVCAGMLLIAQRASANPIEVGDWLHFNGSLGTLGGGAFKVHDVTDSAVADFLTFCVQETQYINYSADFRVGSITDHADDGSGPDPIEPETAWIMSSFSRGLLGGFSSNDIQWSIWKLEGETSVHWGNSAALIGAAHLAILGGWSNDGREGHEPVLGQWHAGAGSARLHAGNGDHDRCRPRTGNHRPSRDGHGSGDSPPASFARYSRLISAFSSTRFGAPRLATTSIARPICSVVVT
jgi:hypothetical protein